jgi:CyaY protein
MIDDIEFGRQADRFMESLVKQLLEFDPDELDADLAMGVLSMTFADRTKCILNRQIPARQVWLALGASAWHFAQDPRTGEWLDTRGRGRLQDILSTALSDKLGRKITL